MVYSWDGHRDECYQVYVVQNKSMDELMDHMRIHHNFTPSKRAFQQQLRRWNFPSKQVGVHRNAPLVDRVRELWEANHSQADMLRVLQDEGYDVRARQLLRLRSHHRLLLRVAKNEDAVVQDTKTIPDAASPGDCLPVKEQNVALVATVERQSVDAPQQQPTPLSSPSRKRRRQADINCPRVTAPRFPSETTLAQSKELLSLDAETYRCVRKCFQQICEKAGLESKTSSGQLTWDDAKMLLVRQVPYLQGILSMEDGRVHHLALDIICTDVTKRMRSHNAAAAGTTRKMTLAHVRNMMGVNPDQAREMREALQNLLPGRGEMSVGDEAWEGLKRQWQETCPVLRRVLENGEEQRESRVKAVDMLARDVLKRYKDHNAKLGEKQASVAHEQDQELPQLQLPPQLPPFSSASNDHVVAVDNQAWNMGIYDSNVLVDDDMVNSMQLAEIQGLGMSHSLPPNAHIPSLDDSLLLAASTQTFLHQQQYMHQIYSYQSQHHTSPIAIYLQPHHASTVMVDSSLWIATLMSPTLDDVRSVAVDKYPGVVCLFVEGVVRDSRNGLSGVSALSQVPLPIDSDQELSAYLQHVQELGVAPTFSVQLHYCVG